MRLENPFGSELQEQNKVPVLDLHERFLEKMIEVWANVYKKSTKTVQFRIVSTIFFNFESISGQSMLQLIHPPTLTVVWSRGMIPALGAGGPGIKPRLDPFFIFNLIILNIVWKYSRWCSRRRCLIRCLSHTSTASTPSSEKIRLSAFRAATRLRKIWLANANRSCSVITISAQDGVILRYMILTMLRGSVAIHLRAPFAYFQSLFLPSNSTNSYGNS